MLKISHLQKNYRGFSLDCSMEVQPGMITGLNLLEEMVPGNPPHLRLCLA